MEAIGPADPDHKLSTRAMRRNARRRAVRSATFYDAAKPWPLRPATTDTGGRDGPHESEATLADVSNTILESNSGNAPLPDSGEGRKYDIGTLLSIGREMESTNLPPQRRRVRFGSEASFIGHADLGFGSPVLGERVLNRRRLSSTVSNNSEIDNPRVNVQYPIRQPKHAPEGTFAQTHEGFQRFLKEHSSPKHRRVTAGGRIVPMEDPRRAPAPEFKLPTNLQSDGAGHEKHCPPPNDNPVTDHPTRKEGDAGTGSAREAEGHVFGSTNNMVHGSHPAKMREQSVPGPPTTRAQNTETARTSSRLDRREKHSVTVPGPNKQLQLSAEANPFTPTYTTFGGNNQLASTALPGYPQVSIPPYMSEPLALHFQAAYPPLLGNATGAYQPQPVVAPPPAQFYSFNATGVPQWSNQMQTFIDAPMTGSFPTCNKTLEEATEDFNNFSSQLSNLDRYLAIHTWDIDSAAKKALVAQRIELVHRLDSARQLKECIESVTPSLRTDGMGECQVAEQVQQPQYPGPFTGQFIPNIAQNAEIPGPVFSPVVNFQQTALPGPMFQAQAVGSQHMNMNSFNHGYENHQTGYGLNYQPSPNNGWVTGSEAAVRSGYNALNNRSATNERPYVDSSSASDGGISNGLSYPRYPEVIKACRKFEEAKRRGEPIEPYMKEFHEAISLYNNAPQNREPPTMDLCRDRERREQTQRRDTRATESSNGTERDGTISEASHRRTAAQERLAALHGRNYSQDSRRASVGSRASHCENFNPCGTFGQRTACPSISEERKREKGKGKARETNEIYSSENKPDIGLPKGPAVQDQTSRRASFFSAFNFAAPWRQRWSGRGSQNIGTTAAQRVNVQGLPPTFDGSTETDERTNNRNDGAGMTSENNVNATKSGGLSNWVSQWYRKAPRSNPHAMDVRALFQMIREEDKALIEKHRDERERRLIW